MGGTEAQQLQTAELVKSHLEMMYANVVASKGRIQWTNIGAGFTLGKGIDSLLNSNIPIAKGIPAVTIGRGGDGGKAHSLDEWWINKEGHKAIQLALLILLMEAGME